MDQMETEDEVPLTGKEDINGDVDDTGQSDNPVESNKIASIDTNTVEAMEVDEGAENVPETDDPDSNGAVESNTDDDKVDTNIDDNKVEENEDLVDSNSVGTDNEVEPPGSEDQTTSVDQSDVEKAETQGEGDIESTEQDLAVTGGNEPDDYVDPEEVDNSVLGNDDDDKSNENVDEDNDFGIVNGVQETADDLDTDIQTSNVDDNVVTDDDILNDDDDVTENVIGDNDDSQNNPFSDVVGEAESETKEQSPESSEETQAEESQPLDTEVDELVETITDVTQDGEDSVSVDNDVNTESVENQVSDTDIVTESEAKQKNFDDFTEMNITENVDSEENDAENEGENTNIDTNESDDSVKNMGMAESTAVIVGEEDGISPEAESVEGIGSTKSIDDDNADDGNGGGESLRDTKSEITDDNGDKGDNSEEGMEVDTGLKIDSVASIKDSNDGSDSDQVKSDMYDDMNESQIENKEASNVREISTEVEDKESESDVTKEEYTEMDPGDKSVSGSVSEGSVDRKSVSPAVSDVMAGVQIKEERLSSTDDVSESEGSGLSNLKIVGVASSVSNNTENNVDGKGDKSVMIDASTENSDDVHKPDKKPDISKTKAEEVDNEVIAVKEEKKPAPKKSSKIQTCIVCHKVVKCKYNIVRNGDVKHLCDDNCFKCFRADPTTYLKQAETSPTDKPTVESETEKQTKDRKLPEIAPKPVEIQPSTPAANQQTQVYKTCTVCQLMNVRTSKPFLNWQGLDFCGEECLGKFQYGLGSNCSYCSGPIFPNNKTRFCCRVGNDVKHFCSSNCQSDFIKRMKLCAYCNKDLTQVKDSFMAPVGNQGTFKDFCSQSCLQKFEEKNNKDKTSDTGQSGHKTAVAPVGDFTCAVCSKVGPVKHEFNLDSKLNRLCSDPCFSAFQYANKLTLNTCDNCSTNLNSEMQAPQYVQFEGQQKRFCSFMCVNSFINSNKKTVLCAWCSTKKSNFDMIERVDANSKYQLFCSLNCLSLYRVNLQASSNQSVVCDQCRKYVPAQYHLTMSDASVRNFCSYGCVMQFQQQFQLPAKQNSSQQPKTVSQLILQQKQQQTTTTRSGRVVTKGAKVVANEQIVASKQQQQQKSGKKDAETFPIISNVRSLAPAVPPARNNVNQSVGTNQVPSAKPTVTSPGIQQKIIIQPPTPKAMRNKSLLCKPITQTKATSCRPHTQMKEVQTDGKAEPDKLPVPVPVPIYCPTPLAMYSLPTPILIPVPVPIPVPIFIPTTKKSANSILKQIKEIREKIPADPLEAELLMMAEAVAGKDDDSSSSSEEDEAPVPEVKETPAVQASGGGTELGEDMLQMALRMASEMTDEPVMDLESSLEPVAVNTEPPPQPKPELPPEPEEEEEYIPSARTRRSRGSNKRTSRPNTSRRNPKRQKIDVPQVYREPTPSPPPPAAPPPDANFHLKYTYGVNAFKHWVIQKNALIEQSRIGQGKSIKTFKSDILQSTADELNYALCLFVKEVRKPNGEEYAVDSIYYLCLGIQQYLFENGRIDNIFTDFYYEKFTEALNEILTRYEPKLNHAGQLVCRIEEEHLWESKQLGAHSPHVLLNSLVYFNTKYFMLKTSDDHLKLSFTHIMKHWKKTASGRGSGTGPNAGRSVYLRYYCPTPQGKVDNQKKKKEEMPVYEQTENLENPLRCPVKLYEFYLSKCPESIKSRNDTFYLQAERSSVPDSPVWYSNISVDGNHLAKLLNRIRLVREIQEAHLHTQPVYI